MHGHLNVKYFVTTSCSPLAFLMTFTYTSNAGLSALYSVITINGTLNLKSLRSEQWSEFKTRWHWRVNPLTPNDPYSGRTTPLTSKRCILYTYSTNIGTEYFKHGIYCPFFPLQNAVCFIILTYLVPVLFKFYIQSVLKFKKITLVPKG